MLAPGRWLFGRDRPTCVSVDATRVLQDTRRMKTMAAPSVWQWSDAIKTAFDHSAHQQSTFCFEPNGYAQTVFCVGQWRYFRGEHYCTSAAETSTIGGCTDERYRNRDSPTEFHWGVIVRQHNYQIQLVICRWNGHDQHTQTLLFRSQAIGVCGLPVSIFALDANSERPHLRRPQSRAAAMVPNLSSTTRESLR